MTFSNVDEEQQFLKQTGKLFQILGLDTEKKWAPWVDVKPKDNWRWYFDCL